jgi:hypothetical protein
MKKLTVFLIVAVAFLFASCDQVLEAFFPEFGEGAMGEASITVDVRLDGAVFGSLDSNTPVRLKAVPFFRDFQGNDFIDFGSVRNSKLDKGAFSRQSDGSGKAMFTFDFLYNARWAVFVWVDKDNEGDIDFDEPGMMARDMNDSELIDFSFKTYPAQMAVYIESWSRIPGEIIAMLQPDQSGDNQAPIAGINNMYPRFAVVGNWLNFDGNWSWDNDGYIKEYIWTLYRRDQYGMLSKLPLDQNPIVKANESWFTWSFMNPGTYVIGLKVRDNQNLVSEYEVYTDNIYIDETAIASNTIYISGTNNTPDSGWYPTYFALLEDGKPGIVRLINTWSTIYDNVFWDIPDGNWRVIAWVDSNWNGLPDEGEYGNNAMGSFGDLVFGLYGGYETSVTVDINDTTTIGNQVPMSLFGGNINLKPYDLALEVFAGGYDYGDGYVIPAAPDKQIRVTFWDPNWNQIHAWGTHSATLDPWGYGFFPDISGDIELQYHPYPGNDYVMIEIDMDGNGYYGDYDDLTYIAMIEWDGTEAGPVIVVPADGWW